jgi:hypothetical protein
VHLNAAGAALLSQSTLDVMTGHLRLEAEVGGYEAAEAAHDPIGNTYAAIAELVGGRSDEVALFDKPRTLGTLRSIRSRWVTETGSSLGGRSTAPRTAACIPWSGSHPTTTTPRRTSTAPLRRPQRRRRDPGAPTPARDCR